MLSSKIFNNILLNNQEIWKSICHKKWGEFSPFIEGDYKHINFKEFLKNNLIAPYKPCHECKIFPIKENRFECMNCENVNYCSKCYNNHPSNHLFIKMKIVNNLIKPSWYYNPLKVNLDLCTSCNEKISISPLYQKKTDSKIIYCKNCFKSNINEYWIMKYPPEDLYNKEKIGKNPRIAYCDTKLHGCLRLCEGINWKCITCYG